MLQWHFLDLDGAAKNILSSTNKMLWRLQVVNVIRLQYAEQIHIKKLYIRYWNAWMDFLGLRNLAKYRTQLLAFGGKLLS